MSRYFVTMPQLGESVTEGTISRWLVGPGDSIAEFDAMVEINTDKVDAEVPAPVTGVLTEILAEEGAVVPVGGNIAVIELVETGAGPVAPAGSAPGTPSAESNAAAASAPRPDHHPAEPAPHAASAALPRAPAAFVPGPALQGDEDRSSHSGAPADSGKYRVVQGDDSPRLASAGG